MIWIKKEPGNPAVTDYYLETIGRAFQGMGFDVTYDYDSGAIQPRKEDMVAAATATSAIGLYLKCRRLIYWAQGVWPEESFLRRKSRLRFAVTSFLEKFVLKRAEFVFLVSDAMKEFYEKKYGLCFGGRCYIMPCSNETLHPESFRVPQKYSGNLFCYAGGISAWQCFEQTVALYKEIEKKHPSSKLLLLVRETEKAREIIRKYDVQNYEIGYVPVAQLPEALKMVKFGFVLREPSAVNRVATPTKVPAYLANGIIPIFSTCLEGIDAILKGMNYCIPYENNGDLTAIERFISDPVDPEEVLQEYARTFAIHYSREKHIAGIQTAFRRLRQPEHSV